MLRVHKVSYPVQHFGKTKQIERKEIQEYKYFYHTNLFQQPIATKFPKSDLLVLKTLPVVSLDVKSNAQTPDIPTLLDNILVLILLVPDPCTR